MELTAEQRAAVTARGSRVAVVAGAGTGKTRVLTARYLHLVAGGARIRRILALTFTEKAAREMKGRIRAALEERASREEARDAEFAPISTIHSFLARLLRERALDVGLDPRSRSRTNSPRRRIWNRRCARRWTACRAKTGVS